MKVCVLVIISLHHQLCLATELGHPEGPHHVLVGEVPVCVNKVSLDDVVMI